jgi:hypothetical protein
VFVLGGIVVGAADVGIALAADRTGELFQDIFNHSPYIVL